MIKIAITGGIGSGKSYISSLLESMDIPVYNADDNSKKIVDCNMELRERLVATLGEDCYIDGRLNKKKLADFIFSSDENRLLINSIIHPYVYQDFLRWSKEHSSSKVIAMESAILYESGFNKYVDKVLMVFAPLETRVARTMARDNATRQQVMARIAAQMDDDKKCSLADFVVYNDGERELMPQINAVVDKLNI